METTVLSHLHTTMRSSALWLPGTLLFLLNLQLTQEARLMGISQELVLNMPDIPNLVQSILLLNLLLQLEHLILQLWVLPNKLDLELISEKLMSMKKMKLKLGVDISQLQLQEITPSELQLMTELPSIFRLLMVQLKLPQLLSLKQIFINICSILSSPIPEDMKPQSNWKQEKVTTWKLIKLIMVQQVSLTWQWKLPTLTTAHLGKCTKWIMWQSTQLLENRRNYSHSQVKTWQEQFNWEWPGKILQLWR